MRKLILLVGFFLTITTYAQTIVLQEDFEGSTYDFTSSSTGATDWGITDSYSNAGIYSDSATVSQNDTLYLTSDVFSTTGNFSIILEFGHICKTSFSDGGYIEYSTDNGASWTKVTSGYLGSGSFTAQGSSFSTTSYPDWLPGNTTTPPSQSWWKTEQFDLSTLIADEANVKIRFALADAGIPGNESYLGWFIDDVKVTAAFGELVPPTISMNYPLVATDTVVTANPITISADITDNSGIFGAYVAYFVNNTYDTAHMTLNTTSNAYEATIPFFGYGRALIYHVVALDNSINQNMAKMPSNGNWQIYSKYVPGIQVVALQEDFESGFPSSWTQPTTDDFDWTHMTGTPTSTGTGPVGAHSGTYYMYIETSPSATWGGVAILETPAFDIDTLITPVLSFYYHMFGVAMGTLNVDVYNGTSWTQAVWTKSGEQHTSESDPWTEAVIDLSSYKSTATKIRFRAIGGTTFTSDIAIDLVTIGDGAITQPDAGLAELVTPTGGVLANSNFDVKVVAENFSGDTINSVDIVWEVNGTPQTTYSYTNSMLPGQLSDTLLLGTQNLGVGAHNLKIWTTNPNNTVDFNASNDTIHFDFYGCASVLSGVYTIGGTTADYPDFSAAALALNQCGISGPVTFNVNPGTYNEQIVINDVSGSSSTNTITFQSVGGDSSLVTMTYTAISPADNYIVKLNNASHIRFHQLGFEAMGTTYAKVFELEGSADVQLTNNYLSTDQFANNATANMALIHGISDLGADIFIENNNLEKGTFAISLEGDTSANNWKVNNNIIIGHYGSGISLINVDDVEIMYNTILADSNSTSDAYNGISIDNGGGLAEISYNILKTFNTQVSYGIRLSGGNFSQTNPAMVYNNMVRLYGNSSTTTLSCGILNQESKNVNYYYNNVHFEGSQSNAATMTIYDGSPTSDSINIVNNNFTNNAGGYIYYVTGVDTSKFNNDYNNLYNWSSSGSSVSGTFAYLNAAVSDMASWVSETGATNSLNYDPYYVSVFDLHTVNNIMNGTAMPIASITDDIDGQPRNATTPDIGADEFDPSPFDVTALEIVTPNEACGLANETVTLRLKNVGSATISGGITASFKIKQSTIVVTENITTTINPGDTIDFVFANTIDLDVTTYGADSTFNLVSWIDLTGDNIHNNDTAFKDINSMYQPPAPITTDTSTIYGTSITLTAQAADSLIWFAYDTSTVELIQANNYTTPLLFDTTTFWVSTTAGQPGSPIVITEIEVGSDHIEIQNVSGSQFDATGWQVIISDNYTNINAVNADTWTLGVMPANSAEWRGDVTGANDWGANMLWNPGGPSYAGWAMIVDDLGVVMDFVAWDWTYNDIVGMSVNAGGFTGLNPIAPNDIWTGDGFSFGTCTQTQYRVNSDMNDATDFVCQAHDRGTPNVMTANGASGGGGGCISNKVPLTVNVIGFPTIDAGISDIISPAQSTMAGVQTYIEVELTNFALNPLTNVDIVYNILGQSYDTLSWTGNLAYGDKDTVLLDSITPAPGIQTLVSYTIMPNGVVDTITANDSSLLIFNACLSGTYTIGSGVNDDFADFNSALIALNGAGVCGDVIFNVKPGTYTGKLLIEEVMGAGPNATITFQSITGDSTDVIVEYAPTNSSEGVLHFNGGDYFTFKSMSFKVATGATYGRAVYMEGDAEHNKILNNVIETEVSTSSNFAGIYSSGSTVSYNEISNNHIKNGYYGIYWYGSGATAHKKSSIIKNNIIEDFYYYGAYFYYNDSLQFVGNKVIAGTNSTSSTVYGVYINYIYNGFTIANNEILITQGGTSTKYGMRVSYGNYYLYVSPSDAKGLVYNNIINITVGTGTKYGFYNYYNNNTDFYYNTVKLSGGGSTVRPLYQTNTSSNTIGESYINNNFIDSVGNYAAYFNTPANVNSCDYNNYYTIGSNLAYWGSNQTDLAALQTASGDNANSVSIYPGFMSATDLRMMTTDVSGLGTPLTEVTTDIDGTTRPTIATTIGAHELPLIPRDIGVISILNVPATTNEGAIVPVSVEVQNFGIDTIVGYSIELIVNGGTPFVNSFPNDTLYTGQNKTVVLNSFVSPAGNSNICAGTILSGDSNTFNNQRCQNFFGNPIKDAKLSRIVEYSDLCNLGVEPISVWINNQGLDTINGPNQLPTMISYNVYDGVNMSTTVSETMNLVIEPGDSSLFTFNSTYDLTNSNPWDTSFNITSWIDYVGDNVGYNDTINLLVESLGQPASPIASDTSANYGDSITLTAITTETLMWFAADTSTQELHKGNSFTTPLLFDTTTYWVGAIASSSVGPAPSGANIAPSAVATASSCNTGACSVFNDLDLGVCGTQDVWVSTSSPPSSIPHTDYIDFEWSQPYSMNKLKIHHAQTTARFLTGAELYYWDGSSWVYFHTFTNLPMQCENDVLFPVVTTDKLRITTFEMNGSGQTSNPNFREIEVFAAESAGCVSPKVPLTVNVVGFPPLDAGISSIVNPSSSVVSGTQQDVKVEIYNYGQNALTTADIYWTINGQAQPTNAWTGNLAYTQSDTVTLTTMAFNGGVYDITAWTDSINNQADTINGNDTSYVTFNACLQGLYTIGDTTGGASYDFPTIISANNAMLTAGICGSVTFEIATGTYSGQLVIDEVPGAGPNSTITFTSQTGDSTDVVVEAALASSSEGVLFFTGGDYFTFSNMTFRAASGSAYGRVVYMEGSSEYNKILNNVIETNVSTSSNFTGIYSSGAQVSYNEISNNHIKNGYYGIYWRGSGSTSHKKGSIIENNIIEGFYYYGAYLYYNDSLQFIGNKVIPGTNSNTVYGVYIYYIYNGFTIANNEVLITQGGSSTKYGMRVSYGNYYLYASPNDAKGLVYNNIINISVGTGTKYGFYNYYNNNTDFYYNTVKLSGGGTTARPLYQTNTSSNTIGESYINNVFVDSVGNYAAYFNTPGNINTCDFNNYFSISSNLAYWSGDRSDLAALQSASNDNANSVNINPLFKSVNDLRMLSTQLSAMGQPLTEVTTDIDGEQRSSISTTLGADEVPLLPIDIGVSAINNVGQTTNEGASIPITVDVTNYGTDTIIGFQVDYIVNNGSLVTHSFPNDTIVPGSFINVTLTPFVSPAGHSNVCATTVLSTDSNAFNDQYCYNFFGTPVKDAYVTRMEEIEGGCGIGLDTVSIWIKNIGIDSINGANQSPVLVKFMNDYGTTANIISETMPLIIKPGDSALYEFTAKVDLTNSTQVDSVFTVTAWIEFSGDNVDYNDTVYQDVNSLHIPNAPTFTSPINIPFGTITTLTAIATPTDSIYWYHTDTSTSEFNVGTSYTTGYNYNDDTLWLEARSGGQQPKITEVCHYTTSSGSPVGGWPSYLTANDYIEITGAPGFDMGGYTLEQWQTSMDGTYTFPPGTILGPNGTAIFAVGQLGSSVPSPSNFYYHANGTYTGLYSSNTAAGRIIKDPDGNLVDAVGVNGYTFPVSANVPTTEWLNSPTGGSGTSGFRLIGEDFNDGSTWVLSTTSPQDPNIVNTGFIASSGGGLGCGSVRVPLVINVTGQQNNDVSVYKLFNPKSGVITPAEEVKIRVRNFGLQAQSNIPVSYRLNGGTPVTETINATLQPNDSIDYTFNQLVNLGQVGQTYTLKVYTHLPTDINYLNDTITVSKQIKWLDIALAVPYFENFDSSGTYWANDTISNQWERGIPTANTLNTAHSAPNVWATKLATTYNATSGDGDKLYTPKFVVDGFDSVIVKFWHNIDMDASNDGGLIQYSIDGVNWPLLGYPGDPAVTNWYNYSTGGNHYWNSTNGWEESSYMIDLVGGSSQFMGIDTIQFRFVLESNGTTSSDGWLVDDFSIELPKVNFDGAVDSITSPKSSPIGSTVTVTASLRNAGLQPISGFPVHYRVGGNLIATETFIGTLQPGDTSSFTFTTTFTAPNNQYNLCVEIDAPNDPYTNNDEVCKAVDVTAALYDVGISRIIYPGQPGAPGTPDTTSLSYNPDVWIEIVNYGVNTITSIPVEYYRSTGTGFSGTGTFTGTLNSGDTGVFHFPTTYASVLGNYQICAKTNLANDANSLNDEVCKSLFGKVTGLDNAINSDFVLHQNEPNPASDNFKINYELPRDGQIRFELHNSLGQLIKVIEGSKSAGTHTIELDAQSMAAGVYYYSLKFGETSKTLKMVVTK